MKKVFVIALVVLVLSLSVLPVAAQGNVESLVAGVVPAATPPVSPFTNLAVKVVIGADHIEVVAKNNGLEPKGINAIVGDLDSGLTRWTEELRDILQPGECRMWLLEWEDGQPLVPGTQVFGAVTENRASDFSLLAVVLWVEGTVGDTVVRGDVGDMPPNFGYLPVEIRVHAWSDMVWVIMTNYGNEIVVVDLAGAASNGRMTDSWEGITLYPGEKFSWRLEWESGSFGLGDQVTVGISLQDGTAWKFSRALILMSPR